MTSSWLITIPVKVTLYISGSPIENQWGPREITTVTWQLSLTFVKRFFPLVNWGILSGVIWYILPLSFWLLYLNWDNRIIVLDTSNFKAIIQFQMQISWLQYFTVFSYRKMSIRILKRDPGARKANLNMMTSSNGKIFRVTGHLCGEFTGPRWIPLTKASDAELWCFLWSASE